MKYRGFELFIHPHWTDFGRKICFIAHLGLTIHRVTGFNDNAAIEAAKRWIDNWIEPVPARQGHS